VEKIEKLTSGGEGTRVSAKFSYFMETRSCTMYESETTSEWNWKVI